MDINTDVIASKNAVVFFPLNLSSRSFHIRISTCRTISYLNSSLFHSISLVQFSRSVVSDFLWPHELQHARPPCPSPIPGVHSDSRPSSQWCHPAISSSVVPFSSCPQSLPASESFPRSQLFAWGDQSTGVSALASFLPKKSQGWSPSEWTGWISLQSKGLSRVSSNTTVQKHLACYLLKVLGMLCSYRSTCLFEEQISCQVTLILDLVPISALDYTTPQGREGPSCLPSHRS